MTSSVRRILKEGEGQEVQKIWEEQRWEWEIFPLKFSPIFCPNLGEEHKERKRSSLKFSPIFCPKLGEEQKKKSSPKFCPIYRPHLGASLKQRIKQTYFVIKTTAQLAKGDYARILHTILC